MSEINNNTILQVKDPGRGWIPVPSIKGTSVYTLSLTPATREIPSEQSSYIQTGWIMHVYDEKKAIADPSYEYDELSVWDGLDGSGAVETVDGTRRTEGTTNIQLDAVSYGHAQSSLQADSDAQAIARENIDAFQNIANPSEVTDGNIIKYSSSSSRWVASTLAPENIGAVNSNLKINNVSINNPTSASASIVLTSENIGAVNSNLKINNVSINNPTSASASIILTPANIGAVHSALKINGKSINNATASNASITLSYIDVQAVPSTRTINGVTLENNIITRIQQQNVQVPCSAWGTSSEQYTTAGYAYKATVSLNNVTSSMVPNVMFNIDDSISGVYAPVAETGTGYVYIYASSLPGVVEEVNAENFDTKVAQGIYIINQNNLYTQVTDQDTFDSAVTYYNNITTTIPTIICFA